MIQNIEKENRSLQYTPEPNWLVPLTESVNSMNDFYNVYFVDFN